MSDYTNTELLNKFHPFLRKYIVELWKGEKIGLCTGNIQVTNVTTTKCEDDESKEHCNCFTLKIPYAGHSLSWDVIFSNDDFTFAPDFYFDDDSFLADPDIETVVKYVPALANWKPESPNSLLNVTKEFLNLYKRHQIKKLEEDQFSRIFFEYCSIVCETGVSIEDVEVLVEPSEVVHFLIAIPVDYSSVPPYIQPKFDNINIQNPGHDTSMLLVSFLRLDGSKTHPQLFLSPNVEQILRGTGTNSIPPCLPEGCLMDYIPEVRKLLASKIEYICTNYRMKNEYISHLIANYGCSIIEYDSLTFSRITLLFETKNFHWLLIINIGNKFPDEKPKWVLRSVYHITSGEPFMEALEDYPYSPRWDYEEMVQRAFTYTLENISFFHNQSIKNCLV